MPKSYKTYRRRASRNRVVKKRKYGRRFGSRGYGRKRRPVPAGIPDHKKVMLKYEDNGTNGLTIPLGSTIVYREYRLNGTYDLDTQLGSEAAIGFTEWANFYKKYHATWAKMTVTFMNTNEFPMYVGLAMRPVQDEASWSSWDRWRDIAGNSFPNTIKMIGAKGSSRDCLTLSIKAPLWKVHGNYKEYMSDVSFAATTDAVPTRQIQGFAFIMTPTSTAAAANYGIFMRIQIKTYVRFYERKLLKQPSDFTDAPEDTIPAGEDITVGS